MSDYVFRWIFTATASMVAVAVGCLVPALADGGPTVTAHQAQLHVERVVRHKDPNGTYLVACHKVARKRAKCDLSGSCSDNVTVVPGQRHLRVIGLDCKGGTAGSSASAGGDGTNATKTVLIVLGVLGGLVVVVGWLVAVGSAFEEGSTGLGVFLLALPVILPIVAIGLLLWAALWLFAEVAGDNSG